VKIVNAVVMPDFRSVITRRLEISIRPSILAPHKAAKAAEAKLEAI
jgi:hypothetical protein